MIKFYLPFIIWFDFLRIWHERNRSRWFTDSFSSSRKFIPLLTYQIFKWAISATLSPVFWRERFLIEVIGAVKEYLKKNTTALLWDGCLH